MSGIDDYSRWLERRLGVPPLIRLIRKAPIDEEWTTGPRLNSALWRDLLVDWDGNLGMLCGALKQGGYLVVVDVDARIPGYEDSLDRLYDLGLPRETVTVLTGGGGMHLYYWSAVPIRKGGLTGYPGIDIQGEGSQVVVPYSIHENGKQYEYEFGWGPDDTALAILPPQFVELFGQHSTIEHRVDTAPADADEEAIAVLEQHFGGHDPVWKHNHYVITRPGKPGGESATVGVISPGGTHVFTSNWPNLPEGNYSLFELCARAGIVAERGATIAAHIRDAPRPAIAVHPLADIAAERVTWLWPWRIPYGKLTFLEGDPGLGKSTLALAIAAEVTVGGWFPDGAGIGHPSAVILLTGEDGIADTVRPRFDVCGGDPSRVFVVEGRYAEVEGISYLDPVTLPADLMAVEAEIRSHGARLVIIDPLAVFQRMKGDSYRDTDMRGEVLGPIAALAERTGCAILALRHLTKSHGTNPLYAANGSIAGTAAARTVLLVGPHPAEPALRVLAVAKSNLAPFPPSLAYALTPVEDSDAARLEWQGEVPFVASDLLSARITAASGEPASEVVRVEQWLRDVLSDNGGELPSEWLKAGASAVGFSWRTVSRARSKLNLRARQVQDKHGRRSWFVSLPPEEDRTPEQDAQAATSASCRPVVLTDRPERQDDRTPRTPNGRPDDLIGVLPESDPPDANGARNGVLTSTPWRFGFPSRSVPKRGGLDVR